MRSLIKTAGCQVFGFFSFFFTLFLIDKFSNVDLNDFIFDKTSVKLVYYILFGIFLSFTILMKYYYERLIAAIFTIFQRISMEWTVNIM